MKRAIYSLVILMMVFISCELKQDGSNPVTPVDPTTGSINITAPKDGDQIEVSSSFEIKWTRTVTENVKIEYTSNNGSSWIQIVESIENTGSYIWSPVPNTISGSCRVRITTVSGTTATDISDGLFSIVAPTAKSLRITKPNGGEGLFATSSYLITWSAVSVANVTLQYSPDNGTSWNVIIASYPADSLKYNWNPIPNIISDKCLIKIIDVAADSINDVSDAVFSISIPKEIKVTSPNGGEKWIGNSSKTITWTSIQVGNVKIEYSINNGVDWIVIAANTPSDGFYTWEPVPNTPSTNAKVRISNVESNNPSDESDGVFSIEPESFITVLAPNGGESWISGSNQYIRWTTSTPGAAAFSGGQITKEADNSFNKNNKRKSNSSNKKKKGNQNSIASNAGGDQIKTIENVKIEYSTNNGASWNTIIASTPNIGVYLWSNIPSHNSSLCVVRISDVIDGVPFDLSDAPFDLSDGQLQSITVTTPNGGDVLNAGMSTVIAWTSTGISSVDIDFTTNNGVDWQTIVSSIPSTGFYTWPQIPSTPSNNCRIRIKDASDGIPYDLSDSEFSITPEPDIAILSPNGGETLQAGSSAMITWTSQNIENVNIDFTTNNGATWTSIVSNTPSDGNHNWENIPNINSTLCRIRISDAADAVPFDASDGNFTISNQIVQSIEVNSPNGSETWEAGTWQNITWQVSGVSRVTISITTNNGAEWDTIATNIASSGVYSWNVPNYNSTQCRVKISDGVDGSPFDESNANFSIRPVAEIYLTHPNGNEIWDAGVSDTIKWTSVGIENVKIEYSSDNGAIWQTLIVSTPSDGAYITSFSVPSTEYKVKISETTKGFPVDESDGVFTVNPQSSLTLLSPNGGERWEAGSSQYVRWNSSSGKKNIGGGELNSNKSGINPVQAILNVKIEFTKNGGSTWETVAASLENNGMYLWSNLPLINSSLCKVKISDADRGVPVDASDQTFTIFNDDLQSINVTSPNGGEIWQAGTIKDITWNSTEVPNVKIEYTTDNGVNWQLIVADTPSDGFYNWGQVPSTASTNCRIRISDVIDGTPIDMSDNTFTIAPEPEIKVITPNGGETRRTGASNNIVWTSTNIENVKVEYSTNNGATWQLIVDNLPSIGSYTWSSVPDVNSSLCRVKISDYDDNAPYDISDNNFSITNQIVQSIAIISPNGGEIWEANTSKNITWSSSGIDSVKIEFTSNGGNTWNKIVDSLSSSGSFEWNVPNINSTQCRVKISDYADSSPFDESNASFSILPVAEIYLTYPNGNEIWDAGVSDTIKWTSVGIENVKIEYSVDNGAIWQTLIVSTPSDGAYITSFSVPSTEYKVKISETTKGFPVDESDGVFTVNPQSSLTLLSPNGGERWDAGSSQYVRWNSSSGKKNIGGGDELNSNKSGINPVQAILSVKIEFTKNGGSTWETVAASVENNGMYLWSNLPLINSSLCKIKISDADRGVPVDISDQTFTVFNDDLQSINVTSPNGGEIWQAGTIKNITWNSIEVPNVKIEYTTDNGVNWQVIVADTPSDGFYTWGQVPSTASTNCRIRISDVIDGTPFDMSDNTFTIAPEPEIRVITPNGGETWRTGASNNIIWTSTNIENVKLEYSTNNGATWQLIVDNLPSIGSYTWSSVPDVNSSLCRVKISDNDDNTPYDISDNNFSITNQIVQGIAIISPNGGEIWEANTSKNITWSSSGIDSVKIEFTSNGGNTWSTITDSLSSSGSYDWNVPNINSTQAKVRVRDYKDGDPSSESNSTFSIKQAGSLSLTKPTSGEVWMAGETYRIEWTSDNVEKVKIEYTTTNAIYDPEATYFDDLWFDLVTDAPGASGYYSTRFTIPSAEYRIRISDALLGSPVDFSGLFTIEPQPIRDITIVKPNGGEMWFAGSSDNIKWTSTNIEQVKIDYTTNNGATWAVVVDTTESDGLYAWSPIPNVSSLQCRIRISDITDPTIKDVSDANFEIIKDSQIIQLTKPNGGEFWSAGTTQEITWNSSGLTNVKIEYTTNNGIAWNSIVASTPSDGHYTWAQVPASTSTNCKIRISDADDGVPSDDSDAFFTISPEPGISVTSPVGGENFIAGASTNITWVSANVANVKIEYTINGGAEWVSIIESTPSDGFYIWDPVPIVNSALCKIRISDALDGNPYDVSAANFTITDQVTQSITIISPNGGEDWEAGTSQNVTWVGVGISTVKIEFTTNNGLIWTTISNSVTNSGAYEWSLPSNLNSPQCKIRVSDSTDSKPIDESDAAFTIKPAQSITIHTPAAGDIFNAGVPITITWTATGMENVGIEYTTTNGLGSIDEPNFYTVTPTTVNNGSLTTSFSIPSDKYYIIMYDAKDKTPQARSVGNFTILEQITPKITVIKPNGGENWLVGETFEIQWSSNGVNTVNIDYSLDGGSTWKSIAANQPSSGLYNWVVDNPVDFRSDNCLIKIEDANKNAVYDESDDFFSIHPQQKMVRVVQPNGGEEFDYSKGNYIKWESSGVEFVDIKYSLNNGVSWQAVISNYPSYGAYEWDAPDIVTSLGRIKITDSSDPTVSDMSDSYFSLIEGDDPPVPFVILLAPESDSIWTITQNAVVKWRNSRDIVKVDIELSRDNGNTWTSIIVDYTESAWDRENSYSLTVTGPATNYARIKLVGKSASGGTLKEIFSDAFKIVP
ncbi:MAG: hypothetical protein ABIJ40_08330 [Bacteroidota bacterium]